MDPIERRMSNLLDTVENPASIPEGAPGSLHRRAWELGERLRLAERRNLKEHERTLDDTARGLWGD